MQKFRLTDVPKHIIALPAGVHPEKKWSLDYNIAAWVRFEQPQNENTKLHLHWADQSGEHHMCVDENALLSSSVLLSGIAHLSFVGEVAWMTVILETDQNSFEVDELFVQPVNHTQEWKRA